MLTIREPMRLQSLSALRTYPDILGEKIAANYRLIGTEITGADLLHMAVQGAEQFVNMEYGGVLSVENHMHVDNQIKLELVNQLVNRLMFCFTPQFTYQDEVFVASVLQKMGIVNGNELIQQVRRHMERNELLNELLNYYFSYGRDRTDIVETCQDQLHHRNDQALQEAYDKECQSALHLHSQIFERLKTAECNNMIYSYNCQTDRGRTAAQGIREAAWIEQADAIQLSQFREILFHQTNPAVWQEDMYYEISGFEQGDVTEKAVVQRIAAAVLENMVQKIHRVRQQYRDRRRVEWRDYTHIFDQSAADVLERFWYFQNEKSVDVRQCQTYARCMTELIRDERVLVQLLAETDSSEKAEDIVLSIWENQNIQKQFAAKMRMEERLADLILEQGVGLAEEAGYREELCAVQAVYQILRQEKENRLGRQMQEARGSQNIVTEQDVQDGQDTLWRQRAENEQSRIQETQRVRSISQQREEQDWRDMPKGQEEERVWDVLQQQEEQNWRDMPKGQEEERVWDVSQQQGDHEWLHLFWGQEERQIRDILQLQEMQIQQDRFKMQEEQTQQDILQMQEEQIQQDRFKIQEAQQQDRFKMQERQTQQDILQMQEKQIQQDRFRIQEKQTQQDILQIQKKQMQQDRFRMQEEQTQQDILQMQEAQAYWDRFKTQEMQERQNDSGMGYRQDLSYQRDSAYDYMSEFLSRYKEFISDQNIPFTENARLLEQVNQHNVSMRQLLDSEEKTAPGKSGNAAKRVVVDQAKARQSALRAMENPQEVLREIYENAPAIEEEFPQEIERILRVTDERTQCFYRRLLGYPEEADHTAAVNAGDGGAEADIDGEKRDIVETDRIHSRHMTDPEEAVYLIHQYKEAEKTQLQKHIDTVLMQIEQKEDRIYQEYVDFDTMISSADKEYIRNTTAMENLEFIANEKDIELIKKIERKKSAENPQFIRNKKGTETKALAENSQFIRNARDTETKEPTENPRFIQNEHDTVRKEFAEDLEFRADKENIGNRAFIENRMLIETPEFHGIDFVHKPEQQISESSDNPENGLSAKTNHILRTETRTAIQTEIQTELKQLKQEQIRQEQLTQQQLQDIKRKLASESEEQLVRLVNRKLRTQVHEISDIVYRELERRLRNEQRRRGY